MHPSMRGAIDACSSVIKKSIHIALFIIIMIYIGRHMYACLFLRARWALMIHCACALCGTNTG